MAKIKAPAQERGSGKIRNPSAGAGSGSGDKEYLHISLRYLRKSHCLTECVSADILSFAEKVRVLTQHSWLELNGMPRHGLGYEKIARHCIKPELPGHITDDVKLIAFRFSGLKPMVGYKEKETFYVLWFDRDFTVYDH